MSITHVPLPFLLLISNVAPMAWARSRMPIMPNEPPTEYLLDVMPQPLSLISTLTVPLILQKEMSVLEAAACLIVLLSDS